MGQGEDSLGGAAGLLPISFLIFLFFEFTPMHDSNKMNAYKLHSSSIKLISSSTMQQSKHH
jgi:hypothetical protein